MVPARIVTRINLVVVEKWLDSGQVMKLQLTGSTEGWSVWPESKRGVKENSKVVGLNTWICGGPPNRD